MLKKIKFNISGMHCRSCKTLIETEIDILPGVSKVLVDHVGGFASVEFDDEKISEGKIFEEIKKLNYGVDDCRPEGGGEKVPSSKSFWLGLLIPVIIIFLVGGYFFLKSLGGFELLAELNKGDVSYGIIFLIGLLVGFHCIGMCGGLVIAYSAPSVRDAKKKIFAPHFQYNFGRLISYAVIGSILGGIGSFFGISPIFTGVVMLLAGVFMILMGFSFIKNWPILEKLKVRTPQFIARFLYNQKHDKKPKGPFIIGLLNGFMPCGPLQAMQLYALASGSAFRGGLSMAIYALGTIPMMFGFGAVISTLSRKYIEKIIKFSGFLVIVLGLIMVNRGLVSLGAGFNVPKQGKDVLPKDSVLPSDEAEWQTVKMDITYFGYSPNVLNIKAGVPVRWVIDAKQMSGCTSAIMIESLGINKNLKAGENIIEFIPPEGVKEIKFSCGMRMVWGKFVVK